MYIIIKLWTYILKLVPSYNKPVIPTIFSIFHLLCSLSQSCCWHNWQSIYLNILFKTHNTILTTNSIRLTARMESSPGWHLHTRDQGEPPGRRTSAVAPTKAEWSWLHTRHPRQLEPLSVQCGNPLGKRAHTQPPKNCMGERRRRRKEEFNCTLLLITENEVKNKFCINGSNFAW